MQIDLQVAIILLREKNKDYEILLFDEHGIGWTLPYGDLVPIDLSDYEGFDDETPDKICVFQIIEEQTNIKVDLIDDQEIYQSKLWTIESNKNNSLRYMVYFGFMDSEKSKEIEDTLKAKKGNAKFVKYDFTNPKMKSLIFPWMQDAIDYQMSYLNKRIN